MYILDQDQSTQASSHDQPQSDTSTAHANERRSHEQQQPISLQSGISLLI